MTIFKHALLVCLALLAACAPVRQAGYTPPETKTGQACIAGCDTAHERCMKKMQDKYDECARIRELDLRRYGDCSHAMSNHAPGGGSCLPPKSCPPPNVYECTENYNACYKACGGMVK